MTVLPGDKPLCRAFHAFSQAPDSELKMSSLLMLALSHVSQPHCFPHLKFPNHIHCSLCSLSILCMFSEYAMSSTRSVCSISSELGKTTPTKINEFSENFRMGGGSFPIRKISLRFFRKFWGGKNNEFSEKGGGSRQSE